MTLSLYELMFNLTDQLCDRYNSLNPFMIRREKASEVFLLINRIKQTANKKVKSDEQIFYDDKGNRIIRRKAKNDDWY